MPPRFKPAILLVGVIAMLLCQLLVRVLYNKVPVGVRPATRPAPFNCVVLARLLPTVIVRLPVEISLLPTKVKLPRTSRLPVTTALPRLLLSINMLVAVRLAAVVTLPVAVILPTLIGPETSTFPTTLRPVSCPTLVILACALLSTVLATLD